METRQYTIQDYLAANETYHFARRSLNAKEPGQLHSHDYYELFVVEDGALEHTVNEHTKLLERGSIVFVRPEDRHILRVGPGGDARVANVIFSPETADHLLLRYPEDLSGRYFWATEETPATYSLTDSQLSRVVEALGELQTAPRHLSRIEEFLLTITTRVLDLPPLTTAILPSWLMTAVEMAKDPSVFRDGAAGFVRAAGRGHEHVCRKTREHLGITPSTLINRIRMEHAAHLLVVEDRSVNDVAENVGIDNMSHFYRVFRQHYGVTPKVYRKQHQRSPF